LLRFSTAAAASAIGMCIIEEVAKWLGEATESMQRHERRKAAGILVYTRGGIRARIETEEYLRDDTMERRTAFLHVATLLTKEEIGKYGTAMTGSNLASE
jgi:hypothetical protein